MDVFVRVFSQPRDRFKLRNWKLTSNIPNPLQLIVVGAVVPPRLGAGAAHLALPALLRLQRARRPPPDGAGDGGRRAEGGDEDGRPRRGGLGGRHHCQAAAAQARGLRRRRSGRRFNAIACHIFSPFSIYFLPKQNTCDLSNSTLSSENDSDSMKSHRRVRTATARACRARPGRRATTATPASPAPSAWRGPAVRGGPGDPRARPAEELCRNGTSRIPAGGRGGDHR